MSDSEEAKAVVTWNDLPRWVQKQRNWYRKYKDELGTPEPEPEWGTVVCSDMDCEHEWQPDWVTPWGPPTPKAKNPRKFTLGECPMCGKQNRRLKPTNPYDFVCHLPDHPGSAPWVRFTSVLLMVPTTEEDIEKHRKLQDEWQLIFEASCHNRYWIGFQEGWFRFLPVSFPYCKGCGAMFASRLPDQEFCSRECGPMPKDYAKRLRKQAASVSPTLRRQEVFERDNWVCHICGGKIDPDSPDRLDRPSLDHIVPIAGGGTHTMDNVRAAHLRCNIQKSDAMLDDDDELAVPGAFAWKPGMVVTSHHTCVFGVSQFAENKRLSGHIDTP